MPDVSVVILNFNGKACLKECLKCDPKDQTCIVASPVKLSKWEAVNPGSGYSERLKLAFQSLFSAYSTKYEFSGDNMIPAPGEVLEEGEVLEVCLHFEKKDNVYKITREELSRESCTN